MANKNFVILIGGPGKYFACDKAHDKSWSNYIVPMQIAAQKNLYQLDGETVHWVVFAPPYRSRWSDDIQITPSEKKEYGLFGIERGATGWKAYELHKSDNWLHQHRQNTAESVLQKKGPDGKNATSYVSRISQICAQNNIVCHFIDKPSEFWSYLLRMPDDSISRVWYSGHASDVGLYLDLHHDLASCSVPYSNNYISVADIINIASRLKPKIFQKTKKHSKFYGCNTAAFTKQWYTEFAVPAEGANNKITFQAIYSGNPKFNVLDRLQTESTNAGAPDWNEFPKPKPAGNQP